jgi:glycosyltransferase involved in cell wall biosynthesis
MTNFKFSEANNALRCGNYDDAINMLLSIIKTNPDFYVYHENLAIAYQEKCKKQEAEYHFKEALKLNSSSIVSLRAIEKLTHENKRCFINEITNDKYNLCFERSAFGCSPLISIIVPVYNSETYIEKCLESLLKQSVNDLEVIIIDDGSTDESFKIIKKYFESFNFIKVFKANKASGNPGTPRNFGIKHATGKYIGFVDSDDWIEYDMFEKLVFKAEQTEAEIVFAGGFLNHNKGITNLRTYTSCFIDDKLSPAYRFHESFMIWDKIYLKDFLLENDIFLGETKAAVDVPFIFKAYFYATNVKTLSSYYGYNYNRETEQSVTLRHRKGSDCLFELQAYKDIAKWLETTPYGASYKGVFNFRKIMSYAYTLTIVAEDSFENLFNLMKQELSEINQKEIEAVAKEVNRTNVLDKLVEIVTLSPTLYWEKYRQDKVAQAPSKTNVSSSLKGSRSGIVFVPDWSARNPYQALLYRSLREAYDVGATGLSENNFNYQTLNDLRVNHEYIHIHWEHVLYQARNQKSVDRMINLLVKLRQIGYKIIWTIHNQLPHDTTDTNFHLDVRRRLVEQCDHILTHGYGEQETLVNEFGIKSSQISVMMHGSYESYYPSYATGDFSRKKLGLTNSAFVVLFFGNIKGYKGVDDLIKAYKLLKKSHSNSVLVIAGRVFDEETNSALTVAKKSDSSIKLFRKYIADEEVQYFFKAANVVVLPYKKILTSGVAVLATTFGTKMLVPRKGLLQEYVPNVLTEYFDTFEQMTLSLIKMASDSLTKEHISSSNKYRVPDKFDWYKIVRDSSFKHIFNHDLSEVHEQGNVYKNKRSSYALIRILGNDLPGLHNESQTIDNLNFILSNEAEFDKCEKIWILNRIVDIKKKNQIVKVLNKYEQEYIDVTFNHKVYSKLDFTFEKLPSPDYLTSNKFSKLDDKRKLEASCSVYHKKNQYAMNNNGARNLALKIGKDIADWVLPWDGNCFVTNEAWEEITSLVKNAKNEKYLIVPMHRVADNKDILSEFVVEPIDEPQIAFHADSLEEFDNDYCYGFKPKVELLRRLGYPGAWDNWAESYSWVPRKGIIAKEANMFLNGGYVLRLASGNQKARTDDSNRANAREGAIIEFLSELDKSHLKVNFDKTNLTLYSNKAIGILSKSNNALKKEIVNLAKTYVENAPYTVVDKTTLPPSGDKHDYWHPAPYAWPNPDTTDGLPYIHKDGQRVPGTQLYEELSNKYDRTSLQRMFDETTVLSIAWSLTKEETFAKKAVSHLNNWFVAKKTRMNPHLKYSQVVKGKNNDQGTKSGLIETKDLYFLLDAARILKKSEAWVGFDESAFDSWLKQFLNWLISSEQGTAEGMSVNNHGNCYDLQIYAIAAYLGDIDLMYKIAIDAIGRMKMHFDIDGIQHHEMNRTTSAHYTTFNLQLWMSLRRIIKSTLGICLLDYKTSYKDSAELSNPISLGIDWLYPYHGKTWAFKQINEFDARRREVVFRMALGDKVSFNSVVTSELENIESLPSCFFPHDGIPILWKLAISE